MKTVVVRNKPEVAQEKIDRLRDYGVATIHEVMGRVGLMNRHMNPVAAGQQAAGRALTVLAQPGDNWMIHAALDVCKPGDLMVLGCTTENYDGMFGDLLMESCIALGVVGLVCDAGVRDTRDIRQRGFPVWSSAVYAKGTVKETLGAVNVPIVCAGQQVRAGDITVGDDDGVVVVPVEQVDQVLIKCQQRIEDEALKREKLAAGEKSLDLYNLRQRALDKGLYYVDELDDIPGPASKG